jgi:hypothetical protein
MATTDYSVFGMAALLPGMQHMLNRMQKELDDFRQGLLAAQNGQAPIKRGRGRPRKEQSDQAGHTSGNKAWANLTPEQRSAEMRRRQQVAKANWLAKNQSARKSNSDQQRQYWASLTPALRKKRIAAVMAGKQRAALARAATEHGTAYLNSDKGQKA